MKLTIENFADIMSVFYKVRISLTSTSPTLTMDAKTWANEHAPDHATMGSAYWFKTEEQAVMFMLRFG